MEHLLDKYNAPVPRYTSYPPANHFADQFSPDDYVRAIEESNSGSPRNVSFYVHIPFCKKLCFYCGCNSSPMAKPDTVKEYVEAIKSEIRMVSAHIDKSRPVSQVHYGGGTPNAIPVRYLQEINELIFSQFSLIDEPEIAIECNPANLDREYIDGLVKAGFNRFSLGIQDFDPYILKGVNREIPKTPVRDIVAMLREAKPGALINLDFIYGLPGQTVESFVRNMEEAAAIKPERLVTFSYAHVPWVNKAQKALEKRGLPNPLDKIKMFLSAGKTLAKYGYKPIGLDHFVVEEDELYKAFKEHLLHRNFQGYCTRRTTGQVYAFGVSSISQLEKYYIQNTKDIKKYIETVSNNEIPVVKGYVLKPEEMVVREVITELMCNKKLDFNTLSQRIGMSAESIKNHLTIDRDMLENFAGDGIIKYNDDVIEVTEDGVLFIRNVAASLDPAFKSQTMKYSRSV